MRSTESSSLLRIGQRCRLLQWAAEGMVKGESVFCRVFHDVRHTLVARGMLVPHKGTGLLPVNQGGTAGFVNAIRPWLNDII